LSVVNPLLGFTGVQSGKLLPLFDGCALTHIERFNLTCALEGKVCGIARFNAGGKNALLGVTGNRHLRHFYHPGQGACFGFGSHAVSVNKTNGKRER
jgi:hypothetical protein